MKISIRMDSAAAQANLRRWGGEFREASRRAVREALREEAVSLKQAMRQEVAGQMRVVRKAFLGSFTAKVLDQDPNRLPALYVGSRIPWVGIHETGGSVGGPLLIPLNGRVGRKRFKAQIAALMRGGNAYFVKNAKGHIVLMAENIKEHDKPLAGFKRRHRKAEGIARLRRGAEIPIAVLVPRVVLRKRLDVMRLAAGRVGAIAARVENFLKQM